MSTSRTTAKRRIAIGLVHQGSTGIGFTRLMKILPADWPLLDEEGGNVPRQRNRVVQRFLGPEGKGCDKLCFIDSDQEPTSATVPALDGTGEELVAANILERRFPFRVAGFWTVDMPPQRVTLHELPKEGLAKLAALGTGCLLVSRRVLEKMTPPWFRYAEFEPDLASEDLGFCVRAVKEAGVQAHLLADARVGHDTRVTVWPGREGTPMMTFPGRPHSWTIPIPTL